MQHTEANHAGFQGRSCKLLVGLGILLVLALSVCWWLFYKATTTEDGLGEQASAAIELQEDGRVQWVNTADNFIIVPAGLTTEKKILLISRCRRPLSKLNARPSCGCMKATIEKSELAYGEKTFLNLTFNVQVKPGTRKESVLVESGEGTGFHKLDFTLKVGTSASDFVVINPSSIVIDNDWEKNFAKIIDCDISLGPDVLAERLQCETSGSNIKASLAEGRNGHVTLKVVIESLRPGQIQEWVKLRFEANGCAFARRIEIEGRIRGSYSVNPEVIAQTIPKGEVCEPEIQVISAKGLEGVPDINVTGNFHLKEIIKLDKGLFRVRLRLNNKEGARFPVGHLEVRTGTTEPSVIVPVYITVDDK